MPNEATVCPLSGQKIIRSTSCTIAEFINYCEDGIVYTRLKSRENEFNEDETREYLDAILNLNDGQPVPLVSDHISFPGWTPDAIKVLIDPGMKVITNGAFIVSHNGTGAGIKVMGILEGARAFMNGDGSRVTAYFKSNEALEKSRAFVLRNSKKSLAKKVSEKLDEDDIKVFAGLVLRMNYQDIMEKYSITNYNRVSTKATTIFEKLGTTNMIAIHEAMKISGYRRLINELLPLDSY